MAITSTSVAICNDALVSIGANTIGSFLEETASSRVCNQRYESIRDATLSSCPFRFSIKQAQLAKLSTTPMFDYSYAFQLPSDYLKSGYLRLEPETPFYDKFEDEIYANENELKCQYQYQLDEQYYSPLYREALVFKLCAEFSLAILEDEQKSLLFQEKFKDQYAKAASKDSINAGPKHLRDDQFSLLGSYLNP